MFNHLVVAHFKENISWLDKINCTKFVYSKSFIRKIPLDVIYEKLPNIGHESHTYLYHIVNNYEKLGNWTLFTQGWPFDHCPNMTTSITFPGFKAFGNAWTAVVGDSLPLNDGRLPAMLTIWKELYNTTFPCSFLNTWGAIFAVASWKIKAKPLRFYEKLLALHKTLPMAPWAMEYLWPTLFRIPWGKAFI